MKKIVFLWIMVLCFGACGNTPPKKTKTKSKSKVKTRVYEPTASSKLPHDLFFKLIDSTDAFVVNHATEFQHVDVPKKMYNTFTGYIVDSMATEVPGLKSLVYYNYTLMDGRIIIGDIFWNDQTSYIIFKIYDKKYVNYFKRDGVQQLKTIFKL